MISCRTKGIPMKEGTRVDAEGFHCFNLDEKQHDPFAVLDRLIAACDKAGGVVPDPAAIAESDRRWNAMMAKRKADEQAALQARRSR
mgnify:CR=1 FL=1